MHPLFQDSDNISNGLIRDFPDKIFQNFFFSHDNHSLSRKSKIHYIKKKRQSEWKFANEIVFSLRKKHFRIIKKFQYQKKKNRLIVLKILLVFLW